MLCPVRTGCLLLSLFVVAAASAGPITYRWVDADGVHYSDQPHPGAEQITLSKAPTYSSGYTAAPVSRAGSRPAEEPFRYDSCAVTSPAQDQVFPNPESITVAMQPHPPMRATDHVVLSYDGLTIGADSNQQQDFRISPVERGTHIVVASVLGADGAILCVSSAVTFHVHQPTIGRPKVTPH